jgi:hypothetical protein
MNYTDCLMSWVHYRHEPHLIDTQVMGVWTCRGYPLNQRTYVKVKVWRETRQKSRFYRMWRGKCTGCDYKTQYWHFGAAYGAMLHHQWKGCESNEPQSQIQR